jgi:hypothetical protein
VSKPASASESLSTCQWTSSWTSIHWQVHCQKAQNATAAKPSNLPEFCQCSCTDLNTTFAAVKSSHFQVKFKFEFQNAVTGSGPSSSSSSHCHCHVPVTVMPWCDAITCRTTHHHQPKKLCKLQKYATYMQEYARICIGAYIAYHCMYMYLPHCWWVLSSLVIQGGHSSDLDSDYYDDHDVHHFMYLSTIMIMACQWWIIDHDARHESQPRTSNQWTMWIKIVEFKRIRIIKVGARKFSTYNHLKCLKQRANIFFSTRVQT